MSKTMQSKYLREFTFPVILEHEKNGGYVVTNPTIDGCYSQGETLEEALKNIKEATMLCMEEITINHGIFQPKDISLHFVQFPLPYAKTSRALRKRTHQKTV